VRVEDDLTVRLLIQRILSQAGHRVRVEPDLHEARKALSEGIFDLLILDLNLPDGSGFDLLQYVRNELGLGLPAIVLSGLRQSRSVARGADLGVFDYITKPFSPANLVASVARALDA
jgi:DNA-binding response OmpR family regulator